jgi:hypothetical protein
MPTRLEVNVLTMSNKAQKPSNQKSPTAVSANWNRPIHFNSAQYPVKYYQHCLDPVSVQTPRNAGGCPPENESRSEIWAIKIFLN